MSTSETAPDPLFSVLRGTPSDAELAALVAVLATLPAPQEPEPAVVRPSGWSDRSRALHAPLVPGPGAWLASARRP